MPVTRPTSATSLAHWGSPAVNQVCADVHGDIGWRGCGLVPVRDNWDGLLPVPGDGRFEWAGYRQGDELPQVSNPPCGWLASANEMNLPGDGEWRPVPISYEWLAPYRAQRIAEVLGQDGLASTASAAALQNDYVSIPARTVCTLLLSCLRQASPTWTARWGRDCSCWEPGSTR